MSINEINLCKSQRAQNHSSLLTETTWSLANKSELSKSDQEQGPTNKVLPEPNPLQIVPTLRQRKECDENTRLHLRDPFLGLIFLHKHHRFRPAAHRRRRGFAARKPLQPRRRAQATGSLVGAVKPLRHRRSIRVGIVPVLILIWRSRTRLAVLIRSRSFDRNVFDLKALTSITISLAN